MFVRLLLRSLVVMVAVLGMSLAFAWVWDRSDGGVQAAPLSSPAGAEAHATGRTGTDDMAGTPGAPPLAAPAAVPPAFQAQAAAKPERP